MSARCAVARTLVVALALAIAPPAAADAPTPRRYPATGTVEIAFTPGDAVDTLIIAAIDRAQTEILVHAYTFTHRRIAQALIGARRRGVAVSVLADREQARAVPQNVLAQLASGGVEVWLDGNFAAAHNKVIVIDAGLPRATTITGSYNFTIAAQRSNAENIVVMHDNDAVARAYRDNWRRLKAGAMPWSDDALR
jgi:phosphatidylserine/phosphatidylglycerophosphate/cardiolipin synthase-like enzyme